MRDVVKQNTAVSVAATSTTVLAANRNRVSLTIINDSAVVIYLAFSTDPGVVPTAVVNSGRRLNASGGECTLEGFTGAVAGISTSGTNVVTVLEI